MTRLDDAARTLDTVGLAAWFGGSLMGAVSLANLPGDDALEFENHAWRRWSPVQTVAIAAHLAGAAKLATTNKGRLGAQRGVASIAIFKAACTAGALGATFYASRLGRTAHHEASASASAQEGDEPVGTGGGSPTLRRLRVVQTAVPILTGAMLVADARMGEQQRPMQVLKGAAERIVPDALHSIPDALHSIPGVLHAVPGAVQSASEKLHAVPVAEGPLELLSKAGEFGRSATASAFAEPVRGALHR